MTRLTHILGDAVHHLTARQSSNNANNLDPNAQDLHVDDIQKQRFLAIGIVALVSAIASLCLLSFLLYRLVFWRNYYKRPLSQNQYVLLIFNLLLADFQQAVGFMICLVWASTGVVQHQTAACNLQGWLVQTSDPASGLFVLAIATHTCAVVLRGRQLPHGVFVACIIALWAFVLVLGFIPVGLFGKNTFVVSEAGWCWLSPEHEPVRLWDHYVWIFLSEFGTVVLYGVMFFYLRRRMRQAAIVHRGQEESLKRLNRVVIYMVVYPVIYVILSLPLAAGRMSVARHNVPSRAYFALAGAMMALSGVVDVLVYTLTRRHLLLETEQSTTDRHYAYSESNPAYQTHVSTTIGTASHKKRAGLASRFRRDASKPSATIASVNDDRDGSTDDIVRKGDMELTDMAHPGPGIYQETTIEISHQPIEPPSPSEKRARTAG